MPSAKSSVQFVAGKLPQMRRHKAKNLAYVNVYGRMVYLGPWGVRRLD